MAKKFFAQKPNGRASPTEIVQADVTGLGAFVSNTNGVLGAHEARLNRPLAYHFLPTDLAGTTLWLDPQASATVSRSGTVVTGISDRSSLAAFYNQTQPALQPEFGATAFNGRPALLFYGPQLLTAPGHADAVLGDATQLTVVAALRSQPGFANTFFGAQTSNGNRVGSHVPYSDGKIYWDAANTNSARLYITENFDSEGVLTLYRNNNFMSIRKNGTELISDNARSGTATLAYESLHVGDLGTGFGLSGALGLLVIVRGALANDDVMRLEGYVHHRTGLSSLLPATHPYRYVPPIQLPPPS